MYWNKYINGYITSKYLMRFSIFCTSQNMYVKQDKEDWPVYLVGYKDRTIFNGPDEADIVAAELEDEYDETFEVIYEGTYGID